jgi:hypothetical protein
MHAHPSLFWAPRLLAVLVCVFLSMFALDAFTPGKALPAAIGDFLIHLMPAAVLAAFVALTWKRPIWGAVAFLAAGTFYAASAWSHPSWVLLISGPLWLVGTLFLLSRQVAR